MTEPRSWRIAPVSFSAVRSLASELEVSELLAEVLVRRGLSEPERARAFLHPDYRVHDPYLMAGMKDARARVDRALGRGEPIAVHGDYDADGITATFLLVQVLTTLGADVRWHLPNRFSEGYGVSATAVEDLAAAGVKLLITVDCGITARDEVALAQGLGMDVIVTDHHELEGEPPGCIVVTPKLGGYPFRDLAGVGVALKLAHALLEDPAAGEETMRELPLALRPLTDVVAVGTVADVVPLVDENRTLAGIGLGRLSSAPRPGLAALMEAAGVAPGAVTAGTVGFRLAPRLNAAGRLADASLALDLLAAGDRETALPLALRLNELNHERQSIEAAMLAAALELVPDPPPAALVLSSPDWHEGVLGIVASRLVERVNRPVILLAESDDEAKGSGRSIPAFDLLTAVEESSARLLAFGGHRAACGVRLRREHIGAFREAFTARAEATLRAEDLERRQSVDAIVGGGELTLELADELELLAPHGLGNAGVTLLLHGAEVVAPRLTRDRRHLQYRVRCDGASCKAIHFNFDRLEEAGAPGRFDIAVALGKDDYNGAVTTQVQVRGLHRLEEPAEDLCATACDAACRERLSGEGLWRALLAAPADGPGQGATGGSAGSSPADAADAAAGLDEARRARRLLDRRGRPVGSTLASLAATGERVLVLVADVGLQRPLLSRDVLAPQLGCGGAYVHSLCAAARPSALAADVVMAGFCEAAARPELFNGFAHVAFVEPPFTRELFAGAVAAAGPQAWIHCLWGRAEVESAGRVLGSSWSLDATMRALWRALSKGGDRFDEALEQGFLGQSRFLPPADPAAAALRTLRESGLLVLEEGGYHLSRPQSKVDVGQTTTHRTWQARFQTPDYLRTCLTAPL